MINSINSSLVRIYVTGTDVAATETSRIAPPFDHLYRDIGIRAYIDSMKTVSESYAAEYKCPIGGEKYSIGCLFESWNFQYAVTEEKIVFPDDTSNNVAIERRLNEARDEILPFIEETINRWYETLLNDV